MPILFVKDKETEDWDIEVEGTQAECPECGEAIELAGSVSVEDLFANAAVKEADPQKLNTNVDWERYAEDDGLCLTCDEPEGGLLWGECDKGCGIALFDPEGMDGTARFMPNAKVERENVLGDQN